LRFLCFIFSALLAFSAFADKDADGNEIEEVLPGCFKIVVNSAGRKVDLDAPVDINGPASLSEEESLHFPFISNGILPGAMLRDIRACEYAGVYVQTIHAFKLIRYETYDHENFSIRLDNPAEAPASIPFPKNKSSLTTVFIEVPTDADAISAPLKKWLAALNWQIQEAKVQVVLLDRTDTHVLAREIAKSLGLLQPDADYELHRIIGTSGEQGPTQ
jgi:hypothetical protein